MQKLARNRFQILEVDLTIEGDDDGWLSYFDDFASDYESAVRCPVVRRWTIRVDADGSFSSSGTAPAAGSVLFHRSTNYPHWNLTAWGQPGRFSLREYGLHLSFDANDGLRVQSAAPVQARAAELVFHAARGLALAVGTSGQSLMLHASAVAIGGRALLFAGTKGAGKSTIFIDAVTHLGAVPLANDRVTLRCGDATHVESWPSYLSYCEGTIMDYPELERAFLAYESSPRSEGLMRWGRIFTRSYTQHYKRIIPTCFLVESLKRRYAFAAPVGALVLPQADITAVEPLHTRCERSTQQLTDEEVSAIVFGDEDMDFPRWHGLAVTSPGFSRRAALLRAVNIPVVDVKFNPTTGKTALRRFLERL